MKDYSDKEIALFNTLGIKAIDNLMLDGNVPAPILYRIAIEHVFCNDLKGPAVQSLRRCAIALRDCSIYRMTPEWDEMINLEY